MVRVCFRALASVLLSLWMVAPSAAQAIQSDTRIHIENFGRVDDRYFRGAQPKNNDYADLAALGIKTVIDLRDDGESDERSLVETAGMTFYRIPMTTGARPSDAAVGQFLRLVNEPSNQPVFVHCQGGRHRTGVMTAVYRMTQDRWTADRAYQEMKQYKFEGFVPHPALKNFVYDYYAHLADQVRAVVASSTQ